MSRLLHTWDDTTTIAGEGFRWCSACLTGYPQSASSAECPSRLRRALDTEEHAHGITIDQRDRAAEAADHLAYAIASQDFIGEHSNLNDPWANAVEVLDAQRVALATQLARADDLAEQVEALFQPPSRGVVWAPGQAYPLSAALAAFRKVQMSRPRDPRQDPRPGDVLSGQSQGRKPWPLEVKVLRRDGNTVGYALRCPTNPRLADFADCGGVTLTVWRRERASADVLVRAEDSDG